MKKLLAMVVALVMALSCTLALAEESTGFPGITISSELDIDREAASQYLQMFGVNEEALPTANGVIALLDALNEKTVIAANGLQYELGLNGNNVLSLGGALVDQNIVLVSSLFPSHAITVSMETITGLLQNALGSILSGDGLGGMPFDVNALTEAISGYAESFIASCTGAVTMGETEVGEFEFDGHTFNAKTAINVDMDTIVEATNTLVEQLENDETVKAAMEAMQSAGVSVEPATESAKLDPETVPNVEGYVYTYVDEEGNASDEVFVVVNVTPKGETEPATIVNTLSLGGDLTVTVEMPAQNTKVIFNNTEKADGSGSIVSFEANASGMYFAVSLETIVGEELQGILSIYFLSDEKPLATATITVAMNGELTMDVSGEGKTAVAIEELMNSGESGEPSEAVSGLMTDMLLNGLGGLLGAVTENVPELSDAIGSLAGAMMGA